MAQSGVVKRLQRRRARASAAPGKIGGHVPGRIGRRHADRLRARMAEGALALRGPVADLAGRGLMVVCRRLWAFARGDGLRFKRNSARQ